MSMAMISTGVACGMLLTAAGLVLWNSYRETPGFARAGQIISWLAAAALFVGFILSGVLAGERVNYLLLTAALAAPILHRRPPSWSQAITILPALIVSLIALFWSPGNETITVMGVMLALCGGSGARALSTAITDLATQTQPISWLTATATYSLLTLLAGAITLINLWQYGTVWSGNIAERQLTGVWVAWSAAQLPQGQPRWLRAGLTVVAALLLITLVASYQAP